jgi:hypothetical protein
VYLRQQRANASASVGNYMRFVICVHRLTRKRAAYYLLSLQQCESCLRFGSSIGEHSNVGRRSDGFVVTYAFVIMKIFGLSRIYLNLVNLAAKGLRRSTTVQNSTSTLRHLCQ